MSQSIARHARLSAGKLVCQGRRILTRFLPDCGNTFIPFVYSNCVCNEYVAIKGRVLGVVQEGTRAGMEALKRQLRAIARTFPKTKEMSRERFIEHFKGKRKTRYLNALKSLNQNPVRRSDAFVSAFIKAEKTDSSSKKWPDPRVIQARSARYNIELGRFLRPIEHHVYRLKHNGLQVMGKGLSPPARAELLVQKWNRFNKPICMAIDASRFDQHVCLEALKLEHWFYTLSNSDKTFAELLSWQQFNKGYTNNGVRYSVKGRRMSGDMNTAVGNCLLMYAMCLAGAEQAGITKFELLVDGDDTLIIVEQTDADRFQPFLDTFESFGHKIKMEGKWKQLEGVQWCQSKFMYIGGKPSFVRSHRKVISTLTAGVRCWGDPSVQKDMMFTVGQALMIDNVGVPILGKYGKILTKWSNKRVKDWASIDEGWFWDIKERHGLDFIAEYQNPLPESRLSFQVATGVSVAEQLFIEEQLESWQPVFGEAQLVDVEVLPGWLTNYRPDLEPIPLWD